MASDRLDYWNPYSIAHVAMLCGDDRAEVAARLAVEALARGNEAEALAIIDTALRVPSRPETIPVVKIPPKAAPPTLGPVNRHERRAAAAQARRRHTYR